MEKGNKVECIINHEPLPLHVELAEKGIKFPKEGIIYTVRGKNNSNGIVLEEIQNDLTQLVLEKPTEIHFHIAYFKLLI